MNIYGFWHVLIKLHLSLNNGRIYSIDKKGNILTHARKVDPQCIFSSFDTLS